MQISIADQHCSARELAAFFFCNLTTEYISHSELQGLRAINTEQWSPDIASVLEEEIDERLGPVLHEFPKLREWRGVVVGREHNALVALSLVTTSFQSRTPYAIIEDIVVSSQDRGHGRGKELIEWIAASSSAIGVSRLFLESGVDNHHAHEFFERLGFRQISVVMMADARSS